MLPQRLLQILPTASALLLSLTYVHSTPITPKSPSESQEHAHIRRAYLSELLGHSNPEAIDDSLLQDLSSDAIHRLLDQSYSGASVAQKAQALDRREKEKRQVIRPNAPPAVVEDLKYHQAYAAAAYCLNGVKEWTCRERCTATPGTVVVAQFDTPLTDTNGFVAHNPTIKSVIVSFRGTMSFQNLLVDLAALPLDFNYTEVPGAKIHAGFRKAYDEAKDIVRNAVGDVLRRFPGYEVRVVGHSLGGALAALAVPDLKKLFPNQTFKLYTYGEPRVGNREFADFVSGLLGEGKMFRVVSANDPIPTMPGTTLNYQHHRQQFLTNPLLRSVQVCQDQQGEDPVCIASAVPAPDVTPHVSGYFDIPFGPFC
ncbi:hypothetical protein HK102_004985 [Quaeritorhiza haematococci]|nr:hypothetical protein HK102_004985 [Quaeritorhiza haematococci]